LTLSEIYLYSGGILADLAIKPLNNPLLNRFTAKKQLFKSR
jgi:hypothetical protein